jgi:hypothetical protein
MVTPAVGRLVLVPFPFSDLSQAKLRPYRRDCEERCRDGHQDSASRPQDLVRAHPEGPPACRGGRESPAGVGRRFSFSFRRWHQVRT